VTSKAAVRTPATSSSGAVPTTSARQGSAMMSTGNDSKPVPVAALAERAAPPGAEELVRYLKFQELPEDDVQAEWIARQAKMYVLIDGKLYRCREGESNSAASPENKARPFWPTFTEGSAPTTWHPRISPGRHSGKDSTGPRPWLTPRPWFNLARHASFIPRTSISQLKHYKPSCSLGHLRSRGWMLSENSPGQWEDMSIYWSPSTSSLSGWRLNQSGPSLPMLLSNSSEELCVVSVCLTA
jgi:hypothetical protein